MSDIGFIGLGAMGTPIARNLVRAGHVLKVFDVRQEIAVEFASENGVTACPSAQAAASNVAAVIVIVPTSDIVKHVCLGEAGIVHAQPAPSLVIDMTSGSPNMTRELETPLAARGIRLIDAPVSGGVTRAISAELAIMVGGDPAAVTAATPLLEAVGKSLFHIGPLGAGQAVKALNNLASATGLLIASEVLGVAKKFGLDPDRVLDVLNDSSGMNNATKTKFKPYILSQTYASGFSLDLMVKDLKIATQLATALEARVPLAQACLAQWEEALAQLGKGHDHTEIAKYSANLIDS